MADPDINREDLMEYFAELDPDKRQRMLDAIEDSDIDNRITDFCRTMYQRRYTDPDTRWITGCGRSFIFRGCTPSGGC